MSTPQPGWLSRNADLLAVAVLVLAGAASNLASAVVESPFWRMKIDRRHFEEMRPAIMEIRNEALHLREEARREALKARDGIRRAVRQRMH